MNKEVYHEGWLTKSPPSKRIWRARWRKRWFTLKQGEIPGQFCLVYYTDRNCRRAKGTIDLDQCEQVDSGLRLEHRKQKFQYMFDVKTPKRIFYLAADTESDMMDWVNCICQVCNLQDLTKQQNERLQYYNIGAEGILNQPLTVIQQNQQQQQQQQQHHQSINLSSKTNSPLLLSNHCIESTETVSTNLTLSTNNTTTSSTTNHDKNSRRESIDEKNYQNDDFGGYRNSTYSNRETLPAAFNMQSGGPSSNTSTTALTTPKDNYYNLSAMSNEMLNNNNNSKIGGDCDSGLKHGLLLKRIPENLKLTDQFIDNAEPSPALSTCSGPYIPISECYTGSPSMYKKHYNNNNHNDLITDSTNATNSVSTATGNVGGNITANATSNTATAAPAASSSTTNTTTTNVLNNEKPPPTPLNSLDPRFYDTPRSHINIGLNLTSEQPYSPKRNNCITGGAGNGGVGVGPTAVINPQPRPRSGSSPTDSESVFTDDEDWTQQTQSTQGTLDRNLRPSDSSIENESIVFTYSQRFSKIPDEDLTKLKPLQEGTTNQKWWKTDGVNGEQNGAGAGVGDDPQTTTTAATAATTAKNNTGTLGSTKKQSRISGSKLVLDNLEDKNNVQSSDTENASPAIGPKDINSCVEESYDIPRSHQLPYTKLQELKMKSISPTSVLQSSVDELQSSVAAASSTPIEKSTDELIVKQISKLNFYTNAAPTKIEGNVFRYDFIEQNELPQQPHSTQQSVVLNEQIDAPVVNRSLKPRISIIEKSAIPTINENESIYNNNNHNNMNGIANNNNNTRSGNVITMGNVSGLLPKPPSIDRKLKPLAPKFDTNSLRRKGGPPISLSLSYNNNNDNEFLINHTESSKTLPRNYNKSSSMLLSSPEPFPSIVSSNNGMTSTQTTTVTSSSTATLTNKSSTTNGGGSSKIPKTQNQTSATLTKPPNTHLEYFELDHSNPPPICHQLNSVSTTNASSSTSASASMSNLSNLQQRNLTGTMMNGGGITGIMNNSPDTISLNSFNGNSSSSTTPLLNNLGGTTTTSTSSSGFDQFTLHHNQHLNQHHHFHSNINKFTGIIDSPGIVYKSVDFVKTEAFKRTRLAAELNRNRLKD